ncbi:MAG: hypothetical protein JNM39_06315 [Bdellovibrionaceae bacterium]|nr:hypothetical protein [Pseudobdellovibrionaceae bacterium]
MLKKVSCILLSAAVITMGCSTHSAKINYSEFKSDISIKAGPWDGQELGSVSGSQGGFIWSDCTDSARSAVEEMIGEAKEMGGNAVGNIRWRARGTSEASCKKKWGWFGLWPFVLTPLFMSSAVDGLAYKIAPAGAKKLGLLMLPTNEMEKAAFIDTVISL